MESARRKQCSLKATETNGAAVLSKTTETKTEELTEKEKAKIKEETGWSDGTIESIKNMKQYEILKNAGLIEVKINRRKCLIKENIDIDYTDEDGVSNRNRITRGLAPLDSKTGKPLELHHLGQKADSPLAELTEEEHRTGEYEDGLLPIRDRHMAHSQNPVAFLQAGFFRCEIGRAHVRTPVTSVSRMPSSA